MPAPHAAARGAGVLWRALALALDAALFCAAFFPVTRLVKGVWLMSAADHRWRHGLFIFDPLCLVFLVLIVAYYLALEARGGTLGKRLLGLRIVDVGGRSPGLRASVIRNALRIVDSLPACYLLGAVLIATSPECTRLGDRLAGTRVIHDPRR